MNCTSIFFLLVMMVGCLVADWLLTMKDQFFDDDRSKK